MGDQTAFDPEDWRDQGPECMRCHVGLNWEGDLPETADDAICHDCAWKELKRLRERSACVTRMTATCAYLADGTKITVERDGKRVWLENAPQAVLRAQNAVASPKGGTP